MSAAHHSRADVAPRMISYVAGSSSAKPEMTDQIHLSTSIRGSSPDRARTGIAGLDAILGGGLPTNHLYLIDGEPGAGKTTLALQFLLEGVRDGEKGLYVTLSESASELQGVADSH